MYTCKKNIDLSACGHTAHRALHRSAVRASWDIWEACWGMWGHLGGIWEASWDILGHLGGILGHLGGICEASWGILGNLRGIWEASWGILGHLGGILGRLGGVLGRLGGVLGRLGGFLLKNIEKQMKINGFLRFLMIWEGGWGVGSMAGG